MFSPNGESIAFFDQANSAVKRVSVLGRSSGECDPPQRKSRGHELGFGRRDCLQYERERRAEACAGCGRSVAAVNHRELVPDSSHMAAGIAGRGWSALHGLDEHRGGRFRTRCRVGAYRTCVARDGTGNRPRAWQPSTVTRRLDTLSTARTARCGLWGSTRASRHSRVIQSRLSKSCSQGSSAEQISASQATALWSTSQGLAKLSNLPRVGGSKWARRTTRFPTGRISLSSLVARRKARCRQHWSNGWG